MPKSREIVITLVGDLSDYVLDMAPSGQAALFRLVDPAPSIATRLIPSATADIASSPICHSQLTYGLEAKTQAQRNALAAAAEIRAGVERIAAINRRNRAAHEKK